MSTLDRRRTEPQGPGRPPSRQGGPHAGRLFRRFVALTRVPGAVSSLPSRPWFAARYSGLTEPGRPLLATDQYRKKRSFDAYQYPFRRCRRLGPRVCARAGRQRRHASRSTARRQRSQLTPRSGARRVSNPLSPGPGAHLPHHHAPIGRSSIRNPEMLKHVISITLALIPLIAVFGMLSATA